MNTAWLCHSVLALSFLAEDLLASPPPLPRRRVEEAAATRRDVRVLKERRRRNGEEIKIHLVIGSSYVLLLGSSLSLAKYSNMDSDKILIFSMAGQVTTFPKEIAFILYD